MGVDVESSHPPEPGASPDASISTARLNFITVGLWISLFIAAIDSTIVTTGLIKISNDLNELDRAAWIVTVYLLTFNAFILFLAKVSDIVGTKAILLVCNFIFLAFSMACGAAQTMTQLIIFRAFQGIGGSGLFTLVFVVIMKLVPTEKLGIYSGIVGSVFAMANLLGPLLGGVIVDNISWRWIFWINGPTILAAIVVVYLAMPAAEENAFKRENIKKIDWVGGFLSVAWPIPFLFALQEGGVDHPWNSSIIIGTLIAGLVGLIIFMLYEAWLQHSGKLEPTFPVRYLENSVMGLLMLNGLFTGFAMYSTVVQLPQRFQAVNGTSAVRAGINLLPMSLLLAVGATVAGVLVSKFSKIKAEYLMLIATASNLVGISLLTTLSVGYASPAPQYGYMSIIGLSLGMLSSSPFVVIKSYLPDADYATSTGSMNMARTMGGCIGVAICSALLHSDLRRELPAFLSAEQTEMIDQSLANLVRILPEDVERVRRVFGESFNNQFRVMIAFAVANVIVTALLVLVTSRKEPIGPQEPNADIANPSNDDGPTEPLDEMRKKS